MLTNARARTADTLAGLLRQSIFGRLAGYGVSMMLGDYGKTQRSLDGRRRRDDGTCRIAQSDRSLCDEPFARTENLETLTALSGLCIARVAKQRSHKRIVLDISAALYLQ